MAKTATAPTAPYFHTKPAREQVRARSVSLEERTAVLETRWEETVPSLATKRDLEHLENRLLKWGIGAGIALLGVFAAVFIANTARMDALDAKLDARFDTLTARQDKLDAKIDARFDALMAEIRALRRVE